MLQDTITSSILTKKSAKIPNKLTATGLDLNLRFSAILLDKDTNPDNETNYC